MEDIVADHLKTEHFKKKKKIIRKDHILTLKRLKRKKKRKKEKKVSQAHKQKGKNTYI